MLTFFYSKKIENKLRISLQTLVDLQKLIFRKVKDLHKYDCLRANKSTMAWGLEARVPFLDREFLEYAMNLDPSCKMSGDRSI